MHSKNGDIHDSSTSMDVRAWVLDTIGVFGPEWVPTNAHVCFTMLRVSYSKCKLGRLVSMYVSILSDNTSSASNIVLRFPLFRSFWGIYNQRQPQLREINIHMSFLIRRFTSLRQRLRWTTIQSILHKMGGSGPEWETQSMVCPYYIAPSLFPSFYLPSFCLAALIESYHDCCSPFSASQLSQHLISTATITSFTDRPLALVSTCSGLLVILLNQDHFRCIFTQMSGMQKVVFRNIGSLHERYFILWMTNSTFFVITFLFFSKGQVCVSFASLICALNYIRPSYPLVR